MSARHANVFSLGNNSTRAIATRAIFLALGTRTRPTTAVRLQDSHTNQTFIFFDDSPQAIRITFPFLRMSTQHSYQHFLFTFLRQKARTPYA